jgi:hypothetical protein
MKKSIFTRFKSSNMDEQSSCPRCNKQFDETKTFHILSKSFDSFCPACKKKAWKTDVRDFTIILSVFGAVGTVFIVAYFLSLNPALATIYNDWSNIIYASTCYAIACVGAGGLVLCNKKKPLLDMSPTKS